ncbi:MAG: tRNA-dihydrouridine synthase [Alteromonadaceae bacterium]|nr:tRNA-dihydrouridine synthase [Alteromonadaceae bacterium]
MEGVVDPLMRDLLTTINNFDFCFIEFIRIIDALLPERVFYRMAPELNHDGYTPDKTPIRIQLLGQHPQWMAENAVRAIELGSHGIDINFGCPAKAVNKSKGGAVLLKTPEEIYKIVSCVKQAVGKEVTTSVKIRLGFDDATLLDEIVDAIVSADADLLTIHARTKRHGYRPPAYWEYIGDIQNKYNIELVANGEIWSKNDADRCKNITNTTNLMLGRGILALPNLANVIKLNATPMSWHETTLLLQKYSQLELQGDKSYYFSSRLKQWLRYLKLQYPEAEILFEKIKTFKNKNDILDEIQLSNSNSNIAK